mgnify:CR=1 FL=1
MEKYMDSRELMEMKEQLSILTKKLEKETIVNDRLMRRTTKEKISKMQRRPSSRGYSSDCVFLMSLEYFISLVCHFGYVDSPS